MLVVAMLLATPCAAQNAPPQTPQVCSPQEQNTDKGTPGSGPSNLSDKLERGEGVICPPPGVDPDIATPPPDVGRTPVIPPPGSPGGNPAVRPK
jgi:hypothetical protein